MVLISNDTEDEILYKLHKMDEQETRDEAGKSMMWKYRDQYSLDIPVSIR